MFTPDAPERLAERLLDALRRRADWPAMRARGRRFVETERNWPNSVARYEKVYAGLATTGPA